jgi:hypothetical protein
MGAANFLFFPGVPIILPRSGRGLISLIKIRKKIKSKI